FKVVYQVVNLDRLAELFPNGGEVGPVELVEAGAVRKGRPVKVLGTGDLGGVRLDVTPHAFSASAPGKIAAARGSAPVPGDQSCRSPPKGWRSSGIGLISDRGGPAFTVGDRPRHEGRLYAGVMPRARAVRVRSETSLVRIRSDLARWARAGSVFHPNRRPLG